MKNLGAIITDNFIQIVLKRPRLRPKNIEDRNMNSQAIDIYPRIRQLFDQARHETHNKGRWLTAAYWVSTLNSMENLERFDLHSFNKAMSNIKYGFPSCEDLSKTNPTGVYRCKYSKRYFYYLTNEDEEFQKHECNPWLKHLGMASGCSKREIMVLFTTARCDTRYRDIWLTSRLLVEILNSMGLNGSLTVKTITGG